MDVSSLRHASCARRVLAVAVVALAATMAWAASPGTNGRIAFEAIVSGDPTVAVVNPDGAGFRPLDMPAGVPRDPAWSPDGLTLAVTADGSGSFRLYLVTLAGDIVDLAGEEGFDYRKPSWSPDGQLIAFERIDRATGDSDVWVVGVDGTGAAAVTTDAAHDGDPAWSPDGTTIAFVSDRDGDDEIWTCAPDGTSPTKRTDNADADRSPDWAPDGSAIVFASDRDGGVNGVWTMGPDGANPARLGDGSAPAFSPDGTTIAFVSGSGDDADIAVMNADGSDPATLRAHEGEDGAPSWQPIVAGENAPPTADAGPDQTIECTSFDGAVAPLDGTASTDPDSTEDESDIALFEWFLEYGTPDEAFLGTGETLDVTLPLGEHQVTLQVTDSVGQTSRDTVVVVVEDTTPPEVRVTLSPNLIWPPNHRMVPVQARVAASDVCSPEVTLILESVTSNEPDNGNGDGNTTGDVREADTGTFDTFFWVRAERSGRGDGRIYSAVYSGTDASGNTALATGETRVVHDQGGSSKGAWERNKPRPERRRGDR